MESESQDMIYDADMNVDAIDENAELEVLSETTGRHQNPNSILLSKDEVPSSAISAPYTPGTTQSRSPAYFHPIPTDIPMDFDDDDCDPFVDDKLNYDASFTAAESQEKSSIKQKFQSQTSLVFYLGIETNQCNKREQRLNLVKYAKIIERLARKTFNNPEIRASLTLPKLTTETIQIYKEEQEATSIDGKDTNENPEIEQLPVSSAEMHIDVKNKKVWIDTFEVKLTPREFSLLTHLVESPNQPVSRNTLLEKIWNTKDFKGKSRTVDVHVRRLRDKLHNQLDLKTVRGVGYIFVGDNSIKYL